MAAKLGTTARSHSPLPAALQKGLTFDLRLPLLRAGLWVLLALMIGTCGKVGAAEPQSRVVALPGLQTAYACESTAPAPGSGKTAPVCNDTHRQIWGPIQAPIAVKFKPSDGCVGKHQAIQVSPFSHEQSITLEPLTGPRWAGWAEGGCQLTYAIAIEIPIRRPQQVTTDPLPIKINYSCRRHGWGRARLHAVVISSDELSISSADDETGGAIMEGSLRMYVPLKPLRDARAIHLLLEFGVEARGAGAWSRIDVESISIGPAYD